MAVRERLLVMGPPGSGKSYQALAIARWVRPAGVKCWVIDTDDAYERMAGKTSDLNHLTILPVFDWPDYREALETVLGKAKEGDWIILDMADNAWSSVQRHFISEVFGGKDIGDYFLDARRQLAGKGDKTAKGKEVKNLGALKGWLDWPVVNKLYEDFILPLIYRSKSHLYIVTKPQTVSEEDDTLTKEIFGAYGVRPAGQKNLGHQCHTIFLYTSSREGWFVTTIKDRDDGGVARVKFDHQRLVSLPIQYLQKYMSL